MNTEGQTMPDSPANDIQEQTIDIQSDPKDLLINALTSERDGLKDQLVRVMAEAQNVQRRLRNQMEDERKFASQSFVERLLPVLDSFERSIAAAEKGASFEALIDGVRVVDKQLRQALDVAQVQRIESVGQIYDPVFHEALMTHETEEYPEDTITDEIEAGYTMHGRVIRSAKVRVAKKP